MAAATMAADWIPGLPAEPGLNRRVQVFGQAGPFALQTMAQHAIVSDGSDKTIELTKQL